MKNKFLISSILFAICFSVTPSSAVDTPNRNQLNFTPGTFAFVFNEGSHGFGHIASILTSRDTNISAGKQLDMRLCTSFNDSRCNAEPFGDFDALTVLNPCNLNVLEPCVKELNLADKNGQIHKASLVRTIEAPSFPADPSVDLFTGGTTSLWNVEGLNGIKNYAVTYFIQSSYGKNFGNKKFTPSTFSAYIYPYVERNVPSATSKKNQESVYPDGRLGITGTGNIPGINCIWTENGKCGVEQEFDEGVIPELTLNVPASLTGWLHGRLIDPEITVNAIGNSVSELRVKAKPADVPSAYAEIPYSQTTDEIKQLYEMNSHATSGSSVRDNVNVAGPSAFKYMAAFETILKDTAQLKSTSWRFGSLDGANNNRGNKCLQSDSKILGLVTTNAMLYENALPTFDSGFLNYKVGGLHFNPDGTPFKGTYDLIMRSETARCLYGFSNAPVSAEISVVSAEGEKQVATTRLTESKDWIHLSAYNFGFSSPTIQMKLEQKVEKTVTPNPISTPTPQAKSEIQSTMTVKKKITITCIKGKIISRVTSVNPKCPKGYKNK